MFSYLIIIHSTGLSTNSGESHNLRTHFQYHVVSWHHDLNLLTNNLLPGKLTIEVQEQTKTFFWENVGSNTCFIKHETTITYPSFTKARDTIDSK